ncbi:MAG: HEPN domain-containing protein [Thermoplasmata archaeon]|nr:HEPN domain-containing protein [Thermoplasmata archaeon]
MNLEECFAKGLLKRAKPDMGNARRSLKMSESYLQDALKNNEIECYRVVVILCYTSIFHAARSLLYKDGVKERSHVCIPIYIKAKYPGLESYANMMDSYRELRHGVFYRLRETVEEKEASEALRSAKEFLAQIGMSVER